MGVWVRYLARVDSRAWRAALLAVLAGLLTCLLCASAPTAFADSVDSSATTASEDYEPGTIPILRLTFHDDVDPETGDVVLTGDEKIDSMNQAPNHSYRATGVTFDFTEVGTIKLVVTEPEPSEGETETDVITYDLNGGTIDGGTDPITEEHKVGDIITIMKAPEREGYTFTYWKGSGYHPGDEYTVTGDHTLTAQWEKNSDGSSGTDDSQTSNGGKNATPKTGDGVLLFVTLSAAAISGAIVLASFRKRRKD